MHLVESMAYRGNEPWHGLGTKLSVGQPLEVWAKASGMDWRVESSDVLFDGGSEDSPTPFPEQQVLYRSDTGRPLAVVSKRFQVVQPAEVLEFYRDLTDFNGFELESAGILKHGRKFWALARTGHGTVLRGGDEIGGYLLLATACDGTLATTAQFTSVRVVCNNTLSVALREGSGAVKVPHRSRFEPSAVKKELGIAISQWDEFAEAAGELTRYKVNATAANDFFRKILTYPTSRIANLQEPTVSERAVAIVHDLFAGRGLGSNMPSASNTAWGLVNSVTEFVDHRRQARSDDHRRDAAWFGAGEALKQKAWKEALKLVA